MDRTERRLDAVATSEAYAASVEQTPEGSHRITEVPSDDWQYTFVYRVDVFTEGHWRLYQWTADRRIAEQSAGLSA